ncbi:MAG TPA: DUF4012 domain-containing protein, partial [Dehalococcoidia bacterium]|nr:DUF4012 domain-containing protein [Dehalococcoidia bacterium]
LRDHPAEVAEAAGLLQRAATTRRVWPHAARSEPLVRAGRALDAALPTIEGAALALPDLADALGAAEPRRYLVISQNNRELRPSGGFMGTYARLIIDQGRVSEFAFGDTYEFEGRGRLIPAPRPVQEYLGYDFVSFRDANWSPDFPTNARLLREMYGQHRGEAIDGVIAVDVEAMRSLLAAVGPVDVPEFGDTIDADNLVERSDQYAFSSTAGESRHKELLGAVAEQLIDRLVPPDPDQVPAIARAVWRSLQDKHILVAVDAPGLAAGLARANFDGHQAAADHDYLMVVDANVGYNKLSTRVRRELAYNLQWTGGGGTADLTVTYELAEAPEFRRLHMYTEYRNYVRIYLPAKVRLSSVDGLVSPPTVEREGDKVVIGGLVRVPPGDRAVIQVKYRYLPGASQAGGGYQLLLQKQAGVLADQVSVRVIDAAGAEVLTWQGEMARDLTLSLAERGANRPAAALLDRTDGILAGFVRWRRGRVAVDNHQGRRYTGQGLMVGKVGSMGFRRLVGQPDEGGEKEAKPATMTHSMLAITG